VPSSQSWNEHGDLRTVDDAIIYACQDDAGVVSGNRITAANPTGSGAAASPLHVPTAIDNGDSSMEDKA
jgi:hypothetical protein